MRLTSAFWMNPALFLIALLASAGIGELIVRYYVPVRNVGPSFTTDDPRYGKALKKRFSCRRITPEFTMKFTTNSDGFRGPALGSVPHQSILFLGDSFTMGYGVNDGEEFPSLIQHELNKNSHDPVPVVNAGIGNNGNGRWVKFLREEGKRYKPGLVVFQIHDNDFGDNVREKLFGIMSDGGLREHPLPSPGARWAIQNVVESVPGLSYSYLIGFTRQVFWDRDSPLLHHDYRSGNRNINNDRTVLEDHLLTGIVKEVLRICKEEKWDTLAIIVDISGERLIELKEFFSLRDIPTIVVPGKRERPDLYYRVDGHWNALGHRFTADRILEHLAGNKTAFNRAVLATGSMHNKIDIITPSDIIK